MKLGLHLEDRVAPFDIGLLDSTTFKHDLVFKCGYD